MRLPFTLLPSCWLLGLLLAAGPAWGQRITLGGEEFMDTTATRPAESCPADIRARYYQVQGKYPRSSATLAAEAQAFVARAKVARSGSGYVTFRFVVDCQGRRLPKTQVLQATPAYQPTRFEPVLVAALYGYLQTLTEWKIATARLPVNYVAYLTFKLQDGNVMAVAP